MGYNIEISVNLIKETNFFDVIHSIEEIANLYNCENLYTLSEEDGTIKIPRYHLIFVIHFNNDNFDNFLKFIRSIRETKKAYIETIYDNNFNKIIYASSFYLTKIDKEASKKYKNFIKNKNFTKQEISLINIFYK